MRGYQKALCLGVANFYRAEFRIPWSAALIPTCAVIRGKGTGVGEGDQRVWKGSIGRAAGVVPPWADRSVHDEGPECTALREEQADVLRSDLARGPLRSFYRGIGTDGLQKGPQMPTEPGNELKRID